MPVDKPFLWPVHCQQSRKGNVDIQMVNCLFVGVGSVPWRQKSYMATPKTKALLLWLEVVAVWHRGSQCRLASCEHSHPPGYQHLALCMGCTKGLCAHSQNGVKAIPELKRAHIWNPEITQWSGLNVVDSPWHMWSNPEFSHKLRYG